MGRAGCKWGLALRERGGRRARQNVETTPNPQIVASEVECAARPTVGAEGGQGMGRSQNAQGAS